MPRKRKRKTATKRKRKTATKRKASKTIVLRIN